MIRTIGLAASVAFAAVMACSTAQAQGVKDLEAAARKEGQINSVGMPDDWANWKDTWADITRKYGLQHVDTDMSSAEEIAKFEAEKENASADIGDVGLEFGPIAVSRKVTQPYKPTTWGDVPDWAKDKDGHWALAYTGTIAFVISKDVKDPPKSWADLTKGDYRVAVGDVGKAAQANAGILAAAIAMGGSESNFEPALDLFSKLAAQKRLLTINASPANMEKGEIQVGVLWDFNALNYRDKVGRDKFTVVIPSDGSVTSGYATIINAHAKHPNAAKLTREFIFSDEGQINLAKGYARPIRVDKVKMPADVQEKLLPTEQYAKARPIDAPAWSQNARRLPAQWQAKVLSQM
jgi:putative spermidine/putrescine transport system substrate-binding protein